MIDFALYWINCIRTNSTNQSKYEKKGENK